VHWEPPARVVAARRPIPSQRRKKKKKTERKDAKTTIGVEVDETIVIVTALAATVAIMIAMIGVIMIAEVDEAVEDEVGVRLRLMPLIAWPDPGMIAVTIAAAMTTTMAEEMAVVVAVPAAGLTEEVAVSKEVAAEDEAVVAMAAEEEEAVAVVIVVIAWLEIADSATTLKKSPNSSLLMVAVGVVVAEVVAAEMETNARVTTTTTKATMKAMAMMTVTAMMTVITTHRGMGVDTVVEAADGVAEDVAEEGDAEEATVKTKPGAMLAEAKEKRKLLEKLVTTPLVMQTATRLPWYKRATVAVASDFHLVGEDGLAVAVAADELFPAVPMLST